MKRNSQNNKRKEVPKIKLQMKQNNSRQQMLRHQLENQKPTYRNGEIEDMTDLDEKKRQEL